MQAYYSNIPFDLEYHYILWILYTHYQEISQEKHLPLE